MAQPEFRLCVRPVDGNVMRKLSFADVRTILAHIAEPLAPGVAWTQTKPGSLIAIFRTATTCHIQDLHALTQLRVREVNAWVVKRVPGAGTLLAFSTCALRPGLQIGWMGQPMHEHSAAEEQSCLLVPGVSCDAFFDEVLAAAAGMPFTEALDMFFAAYMPCAVTAAHATEDGGMITTYGLAAAARELCAWFGGTPAAAVDALAAFVAGLCPAGACTRHNAALSVRVSPEARNAPRRAPAGCKAPRPPHRPRGVALKCGAPRRMHN